MPVAYLTLPRIKAVVRQERLEITVPPGEDEKTPRQRWIPLLDLERVVIDTSAYISSRSITGLLRREIPVIFMQHGSFPAGIAQPFRRQAFSLVHQLEATRDEEFRLRNARLIVNAKIRNMRRVIQRLSSNRNLPAVAAKWLGAMATQAAAAQSLDSLRGIEGAATGRYFETLNAFFPEETPFGTRTRRPPRNEANALLSFGYTLLATEFSLQLHAAGLEPSWGILHETEEGRPALSLDLMEPYRAPLVDALAIDLLNHRRIKRNDFEKSPEGAFLLKKESRRAFYAAWEERLEREFHYDAEERRVSLRSLMADHAQTMRKHFRERGALAPFIMN